MPNAKQSVTAGRLRVPSGDIEDINPDLLLLDPENLRLMERAPEALQKTRTALIGTESVQSRLYETIAKDPSLDIDSLVQSILSSGFLRHESLIVAPYDGTRYLVLEGNRRLTAVRRIFNEYGRQTSLLPQRITATLQTLPCFILEGKAIAGSDETTAKYRRAAEVYVGIRHLMGAKSWDPASRYEFQARLLEDGWSVDDVAAQFGRQRRDVMRDIKAHTLYRGFREYQNKKKLEARVSFNAFAEAARAKAVMDWLGWSDAELEIANTKREEVFFRYVLTNLANRSPDEGEGDAVNERSAEEAVRHLRDILKLEDTEIMQVLDKGDFAFAEVLYTERRQGDFEKKIQVFEHALKGLSITEIADKKERYVVLLTALRDRLQLLITMIKGMKSSTGKKTKR